MPQYKIQGNYYPITTQMYIEDPLFRVTLHTSYSHGASSQYTGTMIFLLLTIATPTLHNHAVYTQETRLLRTPDIKGLLGFGHRRNTACGCVNY